MRCQLNRFLLYIAFVYVLVVTIATGLIQDWGIWYSPSIHHRVQEYAFLRGGLALSADPAYIAHDLSWSRGGVQQVWGLGVPLWRLPFEILARICGQKAFPDILAFAMALGGVAFFALRTAMTATRLTLPYDSRLASHLLPKAFFGKSTWGNSLSNLHPWNGFLTGLGIVLFILLFPPFLNLLASRFDVYEEVVAYEYLYAITLLLLTFTFAMRPRLTTFYILAALAGLAPLVRPTLVFYSAASFGLAAALLLIHPLLVTTAPLPTQPSLSKMRRNTLLLGLALFIFCMSFLFFSNYARFGSVFEFGHKLNVQSLYGSVYATRFDDPWQKEPLAQRAKELFGLLFLSDTFNGGDYYRRNFFTGQSSTIRWREIYLTAYTVIYLATTLTGWICGALALRSLAKQRERIRVSPSADDLCLLLIAIAAIWSILSCVPLLKFYLNSPVISSRYLLDLMPSFCASLIAGWLFAMRSFRTSLRRHKLLPGLFSILAGIWIGYENISASSCYGRPQVCDWYTTQLRLERARSSIRLPADSAYYSAQEPALTKIPYNGTGWEPNAGWLRSIVILYVDNPEFLEIELSVAPGIDPQPALLALRAKIGLEPLERLGITEKDHTWVVVFKGPRNSLWREGLQTAFIASVPNGQLNCEVSDLRLLQIRWRSNNNIKWMQK